MKRTNPIRHIVLVLLIPIGIIASCSIESMQQAEQPDVDFVYNNPPPPPPPVVLPDSCDSLVVVSTPLFITGYLEITEDLTTDRKIVVGDHSEWIYQDQEHLIGSKLDSLLEQYAPQYDYDVYVLPDDNRKVAIIIPGTNDRGPWAIGRSWVWLPYNSRDGIRSWINLKVYFWYNGRKHYFVFNEQAFIFGGALTTNQFSIVIDKYPSVAIFNFRNMEWDIQTSDNMAYRINGPAWKKGRRLADFRYTPVSDSTIENFQCRKWDKVAHN